MYFSLAIALGFVVPMHLPATVGAHVEAQGQPIVSPSIEQVTDYSEPSLLDDLAAQHRFTEIRENDLQAETNARLAIQLEPYRAEHYYQLGTSLYFQQRRVEAETAYREAIRLNPRYAAAYHQLGNTLSGVWLDAPVTRIEEAESAYREAIRLSPNTASFHVSLGKLLEREAELSEKQRFLEAAKAEYREAIAIAPNHLVAYAQLGELLSKQNLWAAARATYREAIRLSPNNNFKLDFYYLLAHTFEQQDNLNAAEAVYVEAIQQLPDEPGAMTAFGFWLQTHQKQEQAIVVLRQATQTFPTNAFVYNAFAGSLSDEASVEVYEEIIRLDLIERFTYDNFSNTLSRLGRREEAIAMLRASMEKHPKRFRIYQALAYHLSSLGRHEEAAAAYQVLIDCDCDGGVAINNQALMLFRAGRYEEVAALYDKYGLDESTPASHAPLARALEAQGKPEDVIEKEVAAARAHYWARQEELAKVMLLQDPESLKGHFRLVEALVRQDKIEAFEAIYQEHLPLRPDYAAAYFSVASVLMARSQFAAAESIYQEILRADPYQIHYYRALGDLYRSQGKLEQALKIYEQAVAFYALQNLCGPYNVYEIPCVKEL